MLYNIQYFILKKYFCLVYAKPCAKPYAANLTRSSCADQVFIEVCFTLQGIREGLTQGAYIFFRYIALREGLTRSHTRRSYADPVFIEDYRTLQGIREGVYAIFF